MARLLKGVFKMFPQYFQQAFPQQQNPYMERLNAMQAQQIVQVSGVDGAKAYNMPANSSVALFDNQQDILYLKSTDGAGFPTIRIFDIVEHKEQPQAQQDFVTRKEFDELKGMILNERNKQTTEPEAKSKK